MLKADSKYNSSVAITITYNLARILEIQCQFRKAEIFYKDILKKHPNYIDCMYIKYVINLYSFKLLLTLFLCSIGYLRLGCIARDRNQIFEAFNWFKKALSIDNKQANAWLLLGNLNMANMKWGSGCKKYEYVLKVCVIKSI